MGFDIFLLLFNPLILLMSYLIKKFKSFIKYNYSNDSCKDRDNKIKNDIRPLKNKNNSDGINEKPDREIIAQSKQTPIQDEQINKPIYNNDNEKNNITNLDVPPPVFNEQGSDSKM